MEWTELSQNTAQCWENVHVHKEVAEARAKYCVEEDQRDEEKHLETQEYSSGH